MDGPSSTKYIETILDYLLTDINLSDLEHRSFRRGENVKQVIRNSDAVSYYLAAIKLISKSKKWPHRTRRVHIR